jgi:DNA-binding transcriptional LysR family regulator
VRAILADIDEAEAMAHAQTREMSGTVRVLALPVVATHIIAPALREFQEAHPEVVIDVDVRESGDPNVEDYDLTVINSLVPVHPTAIVRTITESQGVVCASPDYLRRHGEPKTPEDLRHHRSLRLKLPNGRVRPLRLIDPTDNDREVVLDVPPAFSANHIDTLLRATIEGAGIGSHAAELIAPMLRAGYLQRVLAPWITSRVTLFAVLPSRKYMPARTRAFLDHLVERTRRSMSGIGMPVPPVAEAQK